jgi:alpha-1,2-mannosyltransferase
VHQPVVEPTSLGLRSHDSRGTAWWALIVFGLAFLIYAPTAARGQIHDDPYAASLGAWRIATTGKPWMEGLDTSKVGVIRSHDIFIEEAPNGHRVTHRSPGVIAAAIPLSLLLQDGDRPQDFDPLAGVLTGDLLAAGAVALFFLAIAPSLPRPTCLLVTAVFAFATPVWSVAGNALWTHSVTLLGICGMAWAASRERWWLVGLFGGVALWGRLHAAVIVAVLGVGVAASRRSVRSAVRAGALSTAALALATLWTYWLYGRWSPTGGYDTGGYVEAVAGGAGVSEGSGTLVNHLGLWISPDRGFLVWTPVAVLLAPSLVREWSRLPDWSRWLFVGGILYTVVQGQVNVFTGGDGFFGYRLTLELLACVAPAYAFAAAGMGRIARAVIGPLLGLQFGAFLVGAISEGWFVLRENAWTDNSIWLAVRHEPIVGIWLLLACTVGGLSAKAWQLRHERGARSGVGTAA